MQHSQRLQHVEMSQRAVSLAGSRHVWTPLPWTVVAHAGNSGAKSLYRLLLRPAGNTKRCGCSFPRTILEHLSVDGAETAGILLGTEKPLNSRATACFPSQVFLVILQNRENPGCHFLL